jgi:hypothetical protein
MTAAVIEHAEATDPQEVVAAEQRLRAQARQTAAPMQAEALRVEHQRAAEQMARPEYVVDPQADYVVNDGYVATNGYAPPAPATDPRYADPEYDDGRVDPRYDERPPR